VGEVRPEYFVKEDAMLRLCSNLFVEQAGSFLRGEHQLSTPKNILW
jgi:hypothetical protein